MVGVYVVVVLFVLDDWFRGFGFCLGFVSFVFLFWGFDISRVLFVFGVCIDVCCEFVGWLLQGFG